MLLLLLIISPHLLNAGLTAVGAVFPTFSDVVQSDSSNNSSGLTQCQDICVEQRGSLYTQSYALYFRDQNGPISPFHDIPLFANAQEKIFNMVVEVPRWSNAKMEIATKEPLNPIKQDERNGEPRFVANCFPYHGYIWNYGALPQTWENPSYTDPSIGLNGDNDPIDVCEIGTRVARRGDVVQVKILGILGLIDEGEIDWKLLAIDVKDPMASELNDIADVESLMPGLLNATVEWFRIYKIPDGKSENQFAFNAEVKNKKFAYETIFKTHFQWRVLIVGREDPNGLSVSSVTFPYAKQTLAVEDAENLILNSPESSAEGTVDENVNKWHYITLN